MKKTITTITGYLPSIALLAVTMLVSNALWALPGIKGNDQNLVIHTKAGCATSVNLNSIIDNCQGSQFQQSCGKNGKDCVCIKKNKFIQWTIDTDARFELTFSGSNPFTHNCSMKSGNNSKIKCKIDAEEGDFIYDVIVEGCPGQRYDPKIIIRK